MYYLGLPFFEKKNSFPRAGWLSHCLVCKHQRYIHRALCVHINGCVCLDMQQQGPWIGVFERVSYPWWAPELSLRLVQPTHRHSSFPRVFEWREPVAHTPCRFKAVEELSFGAGRVPEWMGWVDGL
jgi:hypothetical protein